MELIATHRAQCLEAPIPLGALTELVRGCAAASADYVGIRLGQTSLEEEGRWCFSRHAGWLTEHAFRQLCARLSLPGGGTVPAGYLSRCPAPLAARNLNHWLAQPEQETVRLFVRTQNAGPAGTPTVRAVLSHRYAVADHRPLLELLQTMIPSSPLTEAAWSLDDERLIVRLLLNEDHPASPADPLRIGLHISNSEIGLGRVSIRALVTRPVCSNGLVVQVADLGGVQRQHLGRAGDDLYLLVRIGLTRVLAEAEEAARRFAALREAPAPPPVAAFLQRTARKAELPETLIPATLAVLEGETLYDVINAMTLVAQRLPVAERVQVETAMSRFLGNRANEY